MKNLIIILILLAIYENTINIVGTYNNRFGNELEIKPDSTFYFSWNFDLASSWTTGKWELKNDTLILEPKSIYDTVALFDSSNNFIKDTLVLSVDMSIDRISQTEMATHSIMGVNQNSSLPPKRLYFNKERLYIIKNNNKLEKQRKTGFDGESKYPTYYFKK